MTRISPRSDVAKPNAIALFALLGGLFIPAPALLAGESGQGPDTVEEGVAEEEPAAALEGVVVTARRSPEERLAAPVSVSLVDGETIRRGSQGIALDEALSRMPGVLAQNRYNFAQDVRVSVRGFGSRSPFGIRGVRLLLDGIPETLTDGQSQVDMIDPLFLERMELLRGPAGALYGNASGGVLSLASREGAPEGEWSISRKQGSHGLARTGVTAGSQAGNWNWFAGVSRTTFEGFRDHSDSERTNVTARARYEFAPGRSLSLLVDYVDAPDTRDPGSLTAQEVAEDRRQARGASKTFDAGQSAEQGRLGLVYRHALDEDQSLEIRGFQTRRDFENRLPFEAGGAVAFERVFSGGGVQYTRTDQLAGRENRLTVGVDVESQRDDRQRFNNVAGELGDKVFDQVEKARGTGVFLRNDLALTSRWDLSLGLRYDRTRFSIDDRFLVDGDDSGSRSFREVNYFAGTSFELAPAHRWFANVGSSFETPTFTEFANPDGSGGFNPQVGPEQARSVEMGVRGQLGNRLGYELAGFLIRVEGELLPFEPEAGGRDFFRNAGETGRRGVELSVDWEIARRWSLAAALTAGRYRFRDFTDGEDRELGGNRIPGLPGRQGFVELAWGRGTPFLAAINVDARGRVYADDANQVRVPGFAVANLRMAREFALGRWTLEPYAGINNLTDREYSSNIRINTERFVFGGPNIPAPFEPAPGRNWHAGVNLRMTGW